MEMPNETISVFTASVPHLVYSDPLLKKLDVIGSDWVPRRFQAAIKGCHLQCHGSITI